jgi:hypothetical protein
MQESNEFEPQYKRWERRFGGGPTVVFKIVKIPIDGIVKKLKKLFGGKA